MLCATGAGGGLFRQRFVCALACGWLRSWVCGFVNVSKGSAACVSDGSCMGHALLSDCRRLVRKTFCVSAIALGGRFGVDISAVRGLSLVGLH